VPLVVGIDEAGYGPLLGPLVVAASLWRASPEALADDWWQRLRAAVCRRPTRNDWRLPVDDSKQLYTRQRGLAALERAVLAFAAAAECPTETVAALLKGLGASLSDEAGLPPWYRDAGTPLPLDPQRSRCPGATERLRACMAASGLCCRALLAEVVTENRFNARVAQTRNKASVLLEQVLRLIRRATAGAGDQDVYIRVDRLGGRQDYAAVLLSAMPERHLHVLAASDDSSRYRLAGPRSDWYIEFRTDADQHELPVALASMVAKYVREVLMHQFNAHWKSLLPQLRATAGYYQDACRFLADIRPVLPRCGLREAEFVRSR